MSYILDALKKSDKERQRKTAPDPLEIHDYIAHEPRKRWPVITSVAAVVVALGIGIGLLLSWMHPGKTKTQENSGISHNAGSARPEQPESPSGGPENDGQATIIADNGKEQKSIHPSATTMGQPAQSVVKNEMRQAAASQEKIKEKPVQAAEPASLHTTASHEPQHAAQTAPALSEPKTEPQTPAPDANRIYAVSELPLSLQQSLPTFTISAFLYSEDTSGRMVRVNGNMLREGDTLSEGLKLHEIRQDDLIFGYHNYRFRLGVK
jgi:general secretion pathway protein B